MRLQPRLGYFRLRWVVRIVSDRQCHPLTTRVQSVWDIVEDLAQRDFVHNPSFGGRRKGRLWVLNWFSIILVEIVLIAAYLWLGFSVMHYNAARLESFNQFNKKTLNAS
jgi:hypothetical protein